MTGNRNSRMILTQGHSDGTLRTTLAHHNDLQRYTISAPPAPTDFSTMENPPTYQIYSSFKTPTKTSPPKPKQPSWEHNLFKIEFDNQLKKIIRNEKTSRRRNNSNQNRNPNRHLHQCPNSRNSSQLIVGSRRTKFQH